MRESAIAELILSLVISPDRAASTLGDLLEERQTRGSLWFWWSLLGTVSSHVWQDLRLDPRWALRRGLWGIAVELLYSGLLFVVIIPSILGLVAGAAISVHVPAPFSAQPRWAAPLAGTWMYIACPLLIGWQNARRSPQRELASAVVVVSMRLCLLFPAFGSAYALIAPVSMIIGAALSRRRRIAHG